MTAKRLVAVAAPTTLASIGTIGYVWAGYPLLVGLLARYRPVAVDPDPRWTLPTVTVVVAALDEERVIGEKVTELLGSTYPAELLDVVVVTDGSTDATAEVARLAGGSRCRVLESSARAGKPAAVNRGVAAAVGEIVVLSDANNRYEPETVERLVAPFADPSVGATVGAKRVSGGLDAVAVGDGIYWRYESAIKAAESRSGSCTAASGEVMAVRRSSVVELPPGIVNDDFFLVLGVLRSGSRVVYVSDARSVERSSASVEDERARRTRMAAGRFDNAAQGRSLLPDGRRLQWQIVSHKYLRLALPLAFLGSLIGSVVWVAAGGRRFARLLLGGQLAFHAVSVLGRRIRVGGRIGKALGIPSFLLDANIATVRGFGAWRRGTFRGGWDRVQRADDAGEPRRLPAPPQQLEVAS
jgi:biofilm PGA synthesis N-glycosyltransferase PgaC